MSIKRALLEDLLMKEMSTRSASSLAPASRPPLQQSWCSTCQSPQAASAWGTCIHFICKAHNILLLQTASVALIRLKSLSDDDLMLVLEQVHGSTFPLSLTAPSLHSTDDNTTLSAPSSSSSSSSSNTSATQDPVTDRQASHGLASPSSGSAAKIDKHMSATQSMPAPVTGAKLPDAPVGQQAKDAVDKLPGSDERLQQEAKGSAGKLSDVARMRQEAKAAADALPGAWQQQTFRLQAFTRPLMQRLQGEGPFVLPDWLTQVVQAYCLSP